MEEKFNNGESMLDNIKKRKLLIGALIFIAFSGGVLMNNCAKSEDDKIYKGHVVVVFEKGIKNEEAEELLKSYELEYFEFNVANLGKVDSKKAGIQYIIYVPEGEEKAWIHKLRKNKIVMTAQLHYKAFLFVD